MMNGMNNVMGPLMGLMMTYSIVFSVVLLAVLVLLGVWLFQQVRHGSSGNAPHAPSANRSMRRAPGPMSF